MQKKETHEENKEAVDVEDIMLITKEEFVASQFDKGQRIHVAGQAARSRQSGAGDQIPVVKSQQRDGSLDKLKVEKKLEGMDDLSNQKEHSTGKPQSFNSDEFHSAHSKHSDTAKLSDADEPRERRDGQRFPAGSGAGPRPMGALASHVKAEAVGFQGKMTMTQSQRPHPNAPQSKMSRGSNIFVPQNKYFGRYQQAGPQYGHGNHVLTENLQILKAINMNKMQHQYIQNLQKANMTLKCKIKEISQLKTQEDLENFKRQKEDFEELDKASDGGEQKEAPPGAIDETDEEESENSLFEFHSEDDFQLQEVGTIEDLNEKRRQRAQSRNLSVTERKFYDRNSIGKRPRRHDTAKASVRDDETTERESSQVRTVKHQQSSRAGSKYSQSRRPYHPASGKNEAESTSYQPSYKNSQDQRSTYGRNQQQHHRQYQGQYQRDRSRSHSNAGTSQRSQYLNRHKRLQKFGAHNDEVRYPEDYFEGHQQSQYHQSQRTYQQHHGHYAPHPRQQQRNDRSQRYYDDYYNRSSNAYPQHERKQHQRKERDTSQYQLYKYEQAKARPRSPRDAQGRPSPVRKNGQSYMYMRKDRRQQDDSQQLSMADYEFGEGYEFSLEKRIQSQVYESATEHEVPPQHKPAVLEMKKQKTVNFQDFKSQANPSRDLRPAVFIKDLKKRSIALEEEKAQHHRDNKKAFAYQRKENQNEGDAAAKLSKVKKPTTIDCLIDDKQITKKESDQQRGPPPVSLTLLYNGHVAKLERAIKNENLAKLSETLYEVKTNSQCLATDEFYGPQPDQKEIYVLKDKLHRTIVLAEEALIKFSTKSSKI